MIRTGINNKGRRVMVYQTADGVRIKYNKYRQERFRTFEDLVLFIDRQDAKAIAAKKRV